MPYETRFTYNFSYRAPEQETINFLKKTPTPNISDALTRLDLKATRIWGVLPITPFSSPNDHIAGPALTMRFLPSPYKERYLESPYRHTELIESAPRGSVICIEGEARVGIGDRSGQQAVQAGVSAVVSDGPCRDIDTLRQLHLPMFAPGGPIGIKMESYAETMECVAHNIPIYVGIHAQPGAQIRPGDMVVGDNNGVVVIPHTRLKEVVSVAREIVELEVDMKQMITDNKPWSEIYKTVHASKYIKGYAKGTKKGSK